MVPGNPFKQPSCSIADIDAPSCPLASTGFKLRQAARVKPPLDRVLTARCAQWMLMEYFFAK